MGFDILLIGRKFEKSLNLDLPYKTVRFRLLFNKGFLFYAEYNLRLFFKILFLKKHILYANDLDTLLPNFLVSKLSSCKLIYDSHEYFTEVPELISRPKVRSFWLLIEKLIFPHLKNTLTVNYKIADLYEKSYGVSVTVIRNVPCLRTPQKLTPLNISAKGRKIILYQGALNIGRGLELMIDAMALLQNHILLIAGEGDIKEQLIKRVQEKQMTDRVLFLGKFAPEELINLTRQAALGLSLEEDLGLSYRYCLPNKVFDYIGAGIPVLVSDLPLLKELLSTYGVGECLTERSPENLASTIEKIISNKRSYQSALSRARAELNWNNEKQKLIKFMNGLK